MRRYRAGYRAGYRAVTHRRPWTLGERRGCRSRSSSVGRPGRSILPSVARSTGLLRRASILTISAKKTKHKHTHSSTGIELFIYRGDDDGGGPVYIH